MTKDLTLIDNLTEFVFEQNTLERLINASHKGFKNKDSFTSALKEGKLDAYTNTYVLYVNGLLTGQSKEKKLLEQAQETYYTTNYQGQQSQINIYQVPEMETIRALKADTTK